jgi:hypothetical protein
MLQEYDIKLQKCGDFYRRSDGTRLQLGKTRIDVWKPFPGPCPILFTANQWQFDMIVIGDFASRRLR